MFVEYEVGEVTYCNLPYLTLPYTAAMSAVGAHLVRYFRLPIAQILVLASGTCPSRAEAYRVGVLAYPRYQHHI